MSSIAERVDSPFRNSLWAMFLVALLGVMVAGAAFGSIALFRRYEGRFRHLMATDTRLAQQLYNDSVARELEDALLQQQDVMLNNELAAEAAARAAGYIALFWGINNETAARIAEEDVINATLHNETAARIAIDMFFAAEIANLTAGVVSAEQYEVYSKYIFSILRSNVTYLQTLLGNDIAARIAGDALLTEQGAIADAAIAYLIATLAQDIQQRMAQDVLINEWIAALDAIGFGIESINGQTGHIHNDVDIISTNSLTSITVPSPGQMVFTNNAIVTLQGVGAAAGGNIALVGGTGVNVVAMGAHGLHVSTPYTPIGPNSVVLQGIASITFSNAGTIDRWFSVGCPFPEYNDGGGGFGYCGWSAPDTQTYIVQVSATGTVCTYAAGIYPMAAHIEMAFARTDYTTASAHPHVSTEDEGGVLDVVDSTFIGNAEVALFCADLGLSATTVVEGPGVLNSGGLNSGYGVFVFFSATIQGVQEMYPMPVTVTYHVTKVP